ncbi:hypothetical protein J2S13_000046 [Oikeobacillus pervagus]|uniref:YppF-like protein n=1 Tax=Oikeobacillus pervagus TaxID=1325931 RepID=A0AAJ1SYN6_9BACI|nr:YppF family protein [Oikeobacillus pervagus]MDQ0213652.1 hypothetical protein [Oikeobacillus pervagus]
MTIYELKKIFFEKKSYAPHDSNQLLDFAKKMYLFNELSYKEYRNVIRDLELEGAINPIG